jgi:CATRA-associated small protein
MEALRDAVATGDGEAVRRAVADLELAGPVRATRIGAAPLVPVPESVRDRANHLVHALTTEPTEDTAGEQGNDPGGTSAGAHTG